MIRWVKDRVARWAVSRALARRPQETIDRLVAEQGYHRMEPHFYSPIPEAGDLPADYWETRSDLPGLEVDVEAALRMAEEDFPPYLSEFRESFPIDETPGSKFHLINFFYMAVDAHVYYSLLRHEKPKQVLEIGSGMSTRLAAAALAVNQGEGAPGQLTAIEPFPPDHLTAAAADGECELIQKRVQEVPLERFEALEPGDFLFIDSSHVLREGNDVQFEYLEALPRLGPGVWVHVHDISLPRRYPKCYFDQKLYWNEQYLLQAFLAFNDRFEVTWPGNLLMERQPERMRALFPEIDVMRARWPDSEPTAFWMRTRGDPS